MVAQRDRGTRAVRFTPARPLQCSRPAAWLARTPTQQRLLVHTVLFEERRNTFAFWFGCILVTTGVVLHLPMFLMARDSGYLLAGMPMDNGVLLGMAAS